MRLWEWTYSNPRYTLAYCCSYWFGEWNTCSEGGLPLFPSPHLTTSGYPYHQRQLSNLDGYHHCWPNSHKYGAMNIDGNRTCNNDGCLGEDMIIFYANIMQWLHSPYYWKREWNYFYFGSFFIACAQTIIVHHQQSSLVPSMFVSYYWQWVSIGL